MQYMPSSFVSRPSSLVPRPSLSSAPALRWLLPLLRLAKERLVLLLGLDEGLLELVGV